jgi:hypothetical protein
MLVMAMTLRLTDSEQTALKARAATDRILEVHADAIERLAR